MQHLIEAVRKGLRDRNWYASLGLALALPDICGFLESPTNGSQRRYVAWCTRYLEPKYTDEIGPDQRKHVFLSAEDIYALRCAFLHEGADEIARQRARKALDSFLFIAPPPGGGSIHCNQVNSKLQLQVDLFCEDICESVEEWKAAVAGDGEIKKRMDELLMIRDARMGLRF